MSSTALKQLMGQDLQKWLDFYEGLLDDVKHMQLGFITSAKGKELEELQISLEKKIQLIKELMQ